MILRRGLGIWRRREGVYSINLGHGKKKLFCSLYDDHNMQNELDGFPNFRLLLENVTIVYSSQDPKLRTHRRLQ